MIRATWGKISKSNHFDTVRYDNLHFFEQVKMMLFEDEYN